MKKFLGILICVIAFSGCDDGDLIVDTINFDDVNTSTCADNNLLFKLKESESLILNIPEDTFEDTFIEDNTAVGDTIKLDVNNINQVIYNFYDGKVTTAKICDLIPPGFPNTKTQWNATSGVIQVTTKTTKETNETNNSTKITGYNNTIIFKNITFTKADGTTQFYKTFPFGDYKQTITPLPLAFKEALDICSNNQVYKFYASESFTLDIDPDLIENKPTPIDKPREGTIGLVKNRLVYRMFNSVVTAGYFCQPTQPTEPTVKEEWLGVVGGTIQVSSTEVVPGVYKHTIVLKNVSLAKGNSNFQLGNNYKFGDLQK
jgi:hypothetical protein